jgi:hypothetical protein
MRSVSWTSLAILTVAAAGCGGQPEGPARFAVSGQVTVDGEPLDQGLITFVPDDSEGPPAGTEIKNGVYSIPREEGPTVGPHSVSVFSRKPTGKKISDPDDASVTMDELYETIPEKYQVNSPLKADIKAEGENQFNFELVGRIKSPPRTSR